MQKDAKTPGLSNFNGLNAWIQQVRVKSNI